MSHTNQLICAALPIARTLNSKLYTFSPLFFHRVHIGSELRVATFSRLFFHIRSELRVGGGFTRRALIPRTLYRLSSAPQTKCIT